MVFLISQFLISNTFVRLSLFTLESGSILLPERILPDDFNCKSLNEKLTSVVVIKSPVPVYTNLSLFLSVPLIAIFSLDAVRGVEVWISPLTI